MKPSVVQINFCVVLLCVFTFGVQCCDVRYDFYIKTMFGSSLSSVLCMRAYVLFTLFVFVVIFLCVANVLCSKRTLRKKLLVEQYNIHHHNGNYSSSCCQFLWNVQFNAPSVFSNIYLNDRRLHDSFIRTNYS
jgi:hypothetical protein